MPAHPTRPTVRRPAWGAWGAGVLLAVAVALAYANSIASPFVYDDRTSITYNPSIRQLSAWSAVLHPPGGGATVSGRPVLNLSFALNYAFGGLDVRGYHLVNLVIHLGVALTLFSLIRRTLDRLQAAATPRAGPVAAVRSNVPIALGVAALWALHPLHTEAVTYIVQRAESLMSLCFVLTLFGFVRSLDSPHPLRWRSFAWAMCLLGMGTKENMAAAPLVVLLYDRAFVAGTFRAAWKSRRGFYVALASTWLLLPYLVLTTGGDRGGSAGFNVGVNAIAYWLTQIPAVVRYVSLTFWPTPLVFDYGAFAIAQLGSVVLPGLLVVGLLGAAAYALVWRPAAGFLAALAIGVLAPTSIVPGTTQMIVEHRMYLPLAAVLALGLPLAARLANRTLLLAIAAAAIALGFCTAARNRVYRSELALWHDTAVKRPNNAVARSSLGAALTNCGRRDDALAEQKAALALNPNYAPALANLGIALAESGRADEALPLLQRAVAVDPRSANAQLNLGVTLDLLHRPAEALPHYAAAIQILPLLAEAQNDYGDALSRSGKLTEGLQHLTRAVELEPAYVEAYYNLAAAQLRLDRVAESRAAFARGIALRPGDASAHLTWANLLMARDQVPEALQEYQQAVTLAPKSADTHYSYATALAGTGRYDAALTEFDAAIRLRPDYSEAHNNRANTLLALERVAEAIPAYQRVVQLRPGNPAAHNNLGLALARAGRLREAAEEFAAALRLAPTFEAARENLQQARTQLDGP